MPSLEFLSAMNARRLALSHGTVHVGRQRLSKGTILAVAAGFIAAGAALSGAAWESYRTSQREARIFASLSADAFKQGFCDRALRLAVAGLPPLDGAFPLSFRSPVLQGELSSFGSMQDCYFQLALAGHTGLVNSAAFSPDGSRIVTASWDATARVWDATTGAALTTLVGHKAWVHSAAFSPDGTRVVTASWDKTARIWDAATGAVLATLSGHTGPVNGAAFSPDGSRIVTASNDNTARLWDARTGALLAPLAGHDDAVKSAVFSPHGRRVATTSFDGTARVWDVATGATLTTLSGHDIWVWNAAFSPDGSRIVTASEDRTARVWDVATGAAIADARRTCRRNP
jgi:Tol biopolymer transport system component